MTFIAFNEISPIDGLMHSQNIDILQAAKVSVNADQFWAMPGMAANRPANSTFDLFSGDALKARTTIIRDYTNDFLLVVMNGQDTFEKAPSLLFGWGSENVHRDGKLYPYETAAALIDNSYYANAQNRPWQTAICIAHSYGGAVAPWWLNNIRGYVGMFRHRVYTYGAPKERVGGGLADDTIESLRRVFLPNDPVPRLPLANADIDAGVWRLNGVVTARRWGRWNHSSTGLMQRFNRELSPGNIPPTISPSLFALDMFSWLTGSNAFGADTHSLGAYSGAMARVPPAEVRSDMPRSMPAPSLPTQTVAQLETARGVAIVQAGQFTNANPQDALQGVRSGTPIVPGEIYHGGTAGGYNVIRYNGAIVLYVATRRLRRAMVRNLNRSLRI